MIVFPFTAQVSPFPLMEDRPTSSQMSMTSNKGRGGAEEKPKKTASATKKEKSAGKARKEKADDKKKKKSSKTDVKTKKTEKEDESRSNTSPMSSYSEMDATGANLNDLANSSLKEKVILWNIASWPFFV